MNGMEKESQCGKALGEGIRGQSYFSFHSLQQHHNNIQLGASALPLQPAFAYVAPIYGLTRFLNQDQVMNRDGSQSCKPSPHRYFGHNLEGSSPAQISLQRMGAMWAHNSSCSLQWGLTRITSSHIVLLGSLGEVEKKKRKEEFPSSPLLACFCRRHTWITNDNPWSRPFPFIKITPPQSWDWNRNCCSLSLSWIVRCGENVSLKDKILPLPSQAHTFFKWEKSRGWKGWRLKCKQQNLL